MDAVNNSWFFLVGDIQIVIRDLLSYASRVRLGATCASERLLMGRWLIKHNRVELSDLSNDRTLHLDEYPHVSDKNPSIGGTYVWDGKEPLFHMLRGIRGCVKMLHYIPNRISKSRHISKYHTSLAEDGDKRALEELFDNYRSISSVNMHSLDPMNFVRGAVKGDSWELVEWICEKGAQSLEFTFDVESIRKFNAGIFSVVNFQPWEELSCSISYSSWPFILAKAVRNCHHNCPIKRPHDAYINNCIHDLAWTFHQHLEQRSTTFCNLVREEALDGKDSVFALHVDRREFTHRLMSRACNTREFNLFAVACKHGSIRCIEEIWRYYGSSLNALMESIEHNNLSSVRAILKIIEKQGITVRSDTAQLLTIRLLESSNIDLIELVWPVIKYVPTNADLNAILRACFQKTEIRVIVDGFKWFCKKFLTSDFDIENETVGICYANTIYHRSQDIYNIYLSYNLPMPPKTQRIVIILNSMFGLGVQYNRAHIWLQDHSNIILENEHEEILASYLLLFKTKFAQLLEHIESRCEKKSDYILLNFAIQKLANEIDMSLRLDDIETLIYIFQHHC